ncbi:MAG: hypothetical protein JJ992_01520, partial [Planctomycetes bacterium]|nr:hypothetical protein [Planctomycetota bacterium]
GSQQTLTDASKQLAEPPPAEAQDAGADQTPPPDFDELARSQSIVYRWTQILPRKAEQQLKQIPAKPAGPPRRDAPEPPTPNDPNAAMQQLRPALEKAVELGPQIEEQVGQATEHLQQQRPVEALPPQEEALRLLKEIAELLPKQPPQQQPEDQQQPQDQPQNQPQQDQADQPSPKPSPDKQEMSREEAEAMMRQVRDREHRRRELEKQLQRYAPGGIVVDRDW